MQQTILISLLYNEAVDNQDMDVSFWWQYGLVKSGVSGYFGEKLNQLLSLNMLKTFMMRRTDSRRVSRS